MEDVFSHKCPTCGAKIPFDPKTQLWVCDYCGGKFDAEQIKSFEDNTNGEEKPNDTQDEGLNTHDFTVESSNSNTKPKEPSSELNDFNVYTCNNCGAQIVADDNTSATFCVYCGGYTLMKDRLKGAFSPDYIIPFHTTKDEAKAEYLKKIKTKRFAPTDFKSEKNIDKITGVYIPFWTYDCDMRVQKSGSGDRVRSWTSGNYTYTEYKTYNFSRDFTAVFDDVPVDGSKKFDDNLMDSIEPFDYSKKQKFDARYLSGFLAEKYDVDKDEAYKRAQLRMANTANRIVDNTLNFSNQRINTNYVSENKGEVLYWLLPVWMLNTNYNGKMYQFAMNGESKKVVGDFPTSKGKVALFFFISFLISFLICYAISVMYLFGSSNPDLYAMFDSRAYAVNETVLNEYGVPEETSEQKIYDYADLLTDDEERTLFGKIDDYIKKYNMDMGVVTIDNNPKSTATEFADDFYDSNGFGLDDVYSGILLCLDMDTRDIAISTTGKAQLVYDDERIEDLLDEVYLFITSDNYRAVDAFIIKAGEFAESGIPDSNKNYRVDSKGEYVRGNVSLLKCINPFNGKHNYFIIFAVSSFVSGIITLILYSSSRDVRQATNASKYLKNQIWTLNNDTLVNTRTTSHYNPPSSSTSSGGSRSYGGGSSTHHSSSGRSHGGGSRHF